MTVSLNDKLRVLDAILADFQAGSLEGWDGTFAGLGPLMDEEADVCRLYICPVTDTYGWNEDGVGAENQVIEWLETTLWRMAPFVAVCRTRWDVASAE